ncbi:hypothetical protein PF010_g13357 [Phytophthora fragariae]|uniref:Uncharacterized protein n=2 Tax=Phytophthora TaxID=4783 RepID=A0A6A3KFN2_9STRA|nr:hypothetical protein PF011_g11686 [Phytophthora fragariae]KAE9007571.1 hypothetical protein PR002_g16154 [Phytophthora rubi]KAE9104512.1 hypothetical protein PF010_g13357 [Phytophthora fragariae]KAE9210184.1 hypothetical protein PF004_g16253 [Phytophthora fragariae]
MAVPEARPADREDPDVGNDGLHDAAHDDEDAVAREPLWNG